MKLPFSILLLLAVAFSINAQQSPDNNYKVNVSGVISDKDTFEPLPYANISLKGKYIGVVSNEKGEFSFRNIEIFGTDTIVFQYIGYMTSEIPVKELDTNSMVFLK